MKPGRSRRSHDFAINQSLGRQLLACMGNLREPGCEAIASPGPEDNAAAALGRKAAIPVQFSLVGPQAAVRQLPNRFGIHGLDKVWLHSLYCRDFFFRQHGGKIRLTGGIARRKPWRVGQLKSLSHQIPLFGQLNPRSVVSIWDKREPQPTSEPVAYSLQPSLADGHRERQQGLILSQDGTQRNLRSLPQKRLVGSGAPQVRSSLSRLVWSRFVGMLRARYGR